MPALTTPPPRDLVVPEVRPHPTGEVTACDAHPAAEPFSVAIDPLRGFVCLGVVVLHLHGGLRDPLRELFGPWAEFALNYLRLGVESFLLLGGFFVAHMLRPSKANFVSVPRLFVRRFLRLAIPYWVVIALVLASALTANVLLGHHNRFLWPDVLAVATFTQDVFSDRMGLLYPLWSMAPLFQYFVLSMVVYWGVRRVMLRAHPTDFQVLTRRVMILACLVLVVAGPEAVAPGWQLAWWGCVLALGSLTYWWVTRAVGWWAVAALAWFVVAAISDGDVLRVKAAVAVVLVAVLGRGANVPDSLLTRALAWVGQRSYSVYLIHGFVGLRIVNWSLRLPTSLRTDPWVCVGVFAVALAASVVAGAVLYAAVERPVSRLASGIQYRR